MPEAAGMVLVSVIAVVAAIYGYDLIHAYTRLMSFVCGAVLLLAAGWIIWRHGLPADFLDRNRFSLAGFLGVISTGALWQIAYAPYVSDYSRYMPRDTGVRPAFWASYWGCTLGSFLPMVLGAMVGLGAPKVPLMLGLATLTRGHCAAGPHRVHDQHRRRERHEPLLRSVVYTHIRPDNLTAVVSRTPLAHGRRSSVIRPLIVGSAPE